MKNEFKKRDIWLGLRQFDHHTGTKSLDLFLCLLCQRLHIQTLLLGLHLFESDASSSDRMPRKNKPAVHDAEFKDLKYFTGDIYFILFLKKGVYPLSFKILKQNSDLNITDIQH